MERKNKSHQDNMIFLFKIYIGILKKCPQTCSFRLSLIAGVCKGLTRFSFLIDSIYFADLISSLKPFGEDFLSSPKIEAQWDLCHYLVSIFTIASHQRSIQFDLAFHYNLFYKFLRIVFEPALAPFSLHPANGTPMSSSGKRKKQSNYKDIFSEWKSIIQSQDVSPLSLSLDQTAMLKNAITELFSKQTNLPTLRVASFAQRLVWICMGKMSTDFILFVIDSLFAMGKAYPSVFKALFCPSSTSSGDLLCISATVGNFNPSIDDPDNCNAMEYSPAPLLSFLLKVNMLFSPNSRILIPKLGKPFRVFCPILWPTKIS